MKKVKGSTFHVKKNSEEFPTSLRSWDSSTNVLNITSFVLNESH
jgi:hypothetical protein